VATDAIHVVDPFFRRVPFRRVVDAEAAGSSLIKQVCNKIDVFLDVSVSTGHMLKH
jgi:hypothetical protein